MPKVTEHFPFNQQRGLAETCRIGIDKLRLRLLPQSYEKAIEGAISQILYDSHDLEWEAFDERDVELMTGRTNTERQQLSYYPAVRRYTEKQDSLFRQLLPFEYSKALQDFGSQESRWPHATRLAQNIQDNLHIGSPQLGGIVECRAKSLFSLWIKKRDYSLDPDEIYDRVGVRITAKNKESARRISQSLLAQKELMQPHQFRQTREIHQPFVDTSDTPKENGFASIRMNFVDEQFGIYEIQIQTMEDYLKWRRHEKEVFASLAASPKYGVVVELE